MSGSYNANIASVSWRSTAAQTRRTISTFSCDIARAVSRRLRSQRERLAPTARRLRGPRPHSGTCATSDELLVAKLADHPKGGIDGSVTTPTETMRSHRGERPVSEVAPVKGVKCAACHLHVLLRHRPRSIPPPWDRVYRRATTRRDPHPAGVGTSVTQRETAATGRTEGRGQGDGWQSELTSSHHRRLAGGARTTEPKNGT